MIVSIIVALAEDHGIGKDNQLLWHLPADLKFFKNTTTGHTIIMGRKTYDSIGRPLPNRRNIVITRNAALEIAGAEVLTSLTEAIALCREEEEVFVIGGAELYKHALPLANRLYVTQVQGSYEADTFFPEFSEQDWLETHREAHLPDEKNTVAYTFITFERK